MPESKKTVYQELEEKLLKKKPIGWKKFENRIDEIEATAKDYIGYLSRAKTERINIRIAIEWAEKEGFKNIDTFSSLQPGDKVYIEYRGKNLFLAVIGKNGIDQGFNIVASHVDAPRLDLKPSPVIEDGEFALMKTHYYGGIKKYQWVNIPLALIGVVALKNGDVVEISIGDKEEDPTKKLAKESLANN